MGIALKSKTFKMNENAEGLPIHINDSSLGDNLFGKAMEFDTSKF